MLLRCHQLAEREWKLIGEHILGRLGAGRDNRLFVNVVLYRVRTGYAWHDLPEQFGPWNTVARRVGRWRAGGRPCSTPCRSRTTPRCWSTRERPKLMKPRLGKKHARSRSPRLLPWGFCTKVHAVVDALGNYLHAVLTPAKQRIVSWV